MELKPDAFDRDFAARLSELGLDEDSLPPCAVMGLLAGKFMLVTRERGKTRGDVLVCRPTKRALEELFR